MFDPPDLAEDHAAASATSAASGTQPQHPHSLQAANIRVGPSSQQKQRGREHCTAHSSTAGPVLNARQSFYKFEATRPTANPAPVPSESHSVPAYEQSPHVDAESDGSLTRALGEIVGAYVEDAHSASPGGGRIYTSRSHPKGIGGRFAAQSGGATYRQTGSLLR